MAVIIIGAIVIIGGGLWMMFSTRYRVVISSSGVSMPLYGNVTVSAQIQSAGSVFSSWVPAAGTVVVKVGPAGILGPNMPSGACTAAAPLVVTVTGTSTGTDSAKFSGTATNGDSAGSASVSLTVVAAG